MGSAPGKNTENEGAQGVWNVSEQQRRNLLTPLVCFVARDHTLSLLLSLFFVEGPFLPYVPL